MRSRIIQGAVLVASIGAFAGCGSDNATTTVKSTTYVATLSGANEVPARATSATGTATYVMTGDLVTYSVTVNGLTAPVTGSHIHSGPAGANGNVIVPYVFAAVTSGIVTSGTIDLSKPIANGDKSIPGDSLRTLLNNGGAYTNVHTSTFPGGEIRGQILKQ